MFKGAINFTLSIIKNYYCISYCLINDTKGGMRKGGHGLDTVCDCMGMVSDCIANAWGNA